MSSWLRPLAYGRLTSDSIVNLLGCFGLGRGKRVTVRKKKRKRTWKTYLPKEDGTGGEGG